MREELWVNHARMVAEEADSRLSRDGFPDGLVSSGFKARYALDMAQMRAVARACGLFHDLGKLQLRWQRWAEQYQRAKDRSYVMPGALAHTDFDYDSTQDRARSRSIDVSRPPHAAASALYGLAVLDDALSVIPQASRPEVVSACAAAILAHHGSFVPKGSGMDLGILPLVDNWSSDISQLGGSMPDAGAFTQLVAWPDKRGLLNRCVNLTTGLDALARCWPLVAYLMRTLRLADQRATSEWSCRE